MTITLVAAVARNGIIGAGGGMPWHLPDDLRRFKAITMGHTMIMGRKTFDAIGRPLPGRSTIVVTRDAGWSVAGVRTAGSVSAALDLGADGDIMVVGGGEIYAATLPVADRLELTHVDVDVPGDTYFPTIAPADWERIWVERHDGYFFASYRRRPRTLLDLGELLSDLRAEQHDGCYVFASVAGGIPDLLQPVATVAEDEGITLVVSAEQATRYGLDASAPMAWITLRVRSSLQAIGLTAAVTTALTRDGISCNVIAGFHHDHLFVPEDRAADALACLSALAHTRA